MQVDDLDTLLDKVSYASLNNGSYIPSEFSLGFLNFIKLVNGAEGESNKTPPMHLAMLDKISNKKQYIANLCFRGSGKTTTFIEYLSLYLAVFGKIPNFGEVSGMIYVSDSMENGVKSARKNIEHRYNNSEFMQEWVPEVKFTDNYIEFCNKNNKRLGLKMFGATSGIRGTKIFGDRPVLAVLDDLVSDEAAKSKATMDTIKDTIYKGINHALDPTRRKIILNGTPFNKNDIIVEAVESGSWDVNVWPVCEKFPCTEEEFSGAWPDRFNYKFVKEQHKLNPRAFYQELMLRITSEEDRLVQDSEIQWYDRKNLLDKKHQFNFWITTDFATSSKNSADYSVISVWAYSANGNWYWIDGVCKKQTMDKNINDLFRLVQEYKPMQVGVEVTGQQGGFIHWLQGEMINRNIWFNFASSSNSGAPGIRPTADKLSRFNIVVPWFKAGKMFFPQELKHTDIMNVFMEQIRFATVNGIKGKDDCIDTISMLASLKPWKPADASPTSSHENDMWDDEPIRQSISLENYIV